MEYLGIIVFFCFVSMGIGYLIGKWYIKHWMDKNEPPSR